MNIKSYEIEHQSEQHRFILRKDANECVLDYEINSHADKPLIDFTHTYVPFGLRGQGLAEVLVAEGLAWAEAQGYKIEASCWYVRKFLK